MSYTIALAGKGGTGKTTIAALIVRLLKEKKSGSILAIDADPNSNLAEALGLAPGQTIGGMLDDIAAHPSKVPAGISKDRFIEYEIQTIIQEGEGFDLISMGRPEGPGCYCYVNNVLRGLAAKLINDYDYVVIDNEAGLEHLSRRTSRAADVLAVVSDATVQGLKAARRISELAKELKIKTGRNILIVNRSEEGIGDVSPTGLEYIGNIPQDKQIEKISLNGGSLMSLEDSASSIASLRRLGEKIWLKR